MPNNSVVIFLGGHGALSKQKTVEDKTLGSYHVILPPKAGGRFCYVAHNMISQNLMLSETVYELPGQNHRLLIFHEFIIMSFSQRLVSSKDS